MSATNLLAVVVLSCMLLAPYAMIPSFGLETAASIRDKLRDRDFRIRPSRGIRIDTANFQVRIADLSNFPALAGQDVQSTIVQVTIKAGQPFFRHFHPRATETLNALQGSLMNSFIYAGLGDVRNISNVIHAGESTVFPEGLVHETICVSKIDCKFLSVLNSADPGTVPV